MKSIRPDLPDSSSLVHSLLAATVRLSGARAGIVRALSASDAGRSHLIASCGLSKKLHAQETSISGPCGICSEAVSRRNIRTVDVVDQSADILKRDLHEPVCMATVAVPLNYEGRTIGVSALFFEGECRLRRQVVAVLRLVGRVLAFAIANPDGQNGGCTLLRERSVPHEESFERIGDDFILAESFLCDEDTSVEEKAGDSDHIADELTQRELEVLENIALGLTNKAIARRLGISHETVRRHVRNIFWKLGFSSRLEAALFFTNR